MTDTARGMIENMAYLIDQYVSTNYMHHKATTSVQSPPTFISFSYSVPRYGLVPNGGRVYYTRRSQPPLLAQMVWLYYTATGNTSFVSQLLPSLDREYQFWMTNRTVSVSPSGSSSASVLNQYRADTTTPRWVWRLRWCKLLFSEYCIQARVVSWRFGVSISDTKWLVKEITNYISIVDSCSFFHSKHTFTDTPHILFTNLASGAESGWDFSSRWLSSAAELSSIQTTTILPVDLNAILCQNERTLEQLHLLNGIVQYICDCW